MRTRPGIKVCGMKDRDNVIAVAALEPDYMGFILYRNSPRYVDPETLHGLLSCVPTAIKKTAVLVNEPLERACRIARSGQFDLFQLHGDETPEYCRKLSEYAELIKAFRITDSLPSDLEAYMPCCKMFLFDTAGSKYGGTGKKFNHNILSFYNLEKDFILSGGISPADAESVACLNFPHLTAADLNSCFEVSPGIKDIGLLKDFIHKIRNINVC